VLVDQRYNIHGAMISARLFSIAALLSVCLKPSVGWNPSSMLTKRRGFLATLTGSASALIAAPRPDALAQPSEFSNMDTQAPLPSSAASGETQFTTLANGVKIKDMAQGTGEAVAVGSRVSVQCSGRLLNLNGVIFYNTKNNNPDGFGAIPLTFTLGKGEALPGFESGIVGMKKAGIRRIIVPAELAYSKFPELEPKPLTELDRRALDSVVKNPNRDATILFDVKLERFK
jgi:hypothetical protein